MVWRKVMAAVLVTVAASPAWSAAEPLGSITSAREATIRDSKLNEGSTVFSGDVIHVSTDGLTRVALAGGSPLEGLGGSSARLSKSERRVQMSVEQGQAFFRPIGDSGITAVISDVTVRPLNSSETSAVIQRSTAKHAIIAAEKG